MSLGSTWDVTDKIRLEGQLKRETSDYSGAAVIPSVQGERKDTVRRAEIKMTYKPTPELQLVAQAYHGDRSSTLAGNSYPGSGVLLATRYEF